MYLTQYCPSSVICPPSAQCPVSTHYCILPYMQQGGWGLACASCMTHETSQCIFFGLQFLLCHMAAEHTHMKMCHALYTWAHGLQQLTSLLWVTVERVIQSVQRTANFILLDQWSHPFYRGLLDQAYMRPHGRSVLALPPRTTWAACITFSTVMYFISAHSPVKQKLIHGICNWCIFMFCWH